MEQPGKQFTFTYRADYLILYLILMVFLFYSVAYFVPKIRSPASPRPGQM